MISTLGKAAALAIVTMHFSSGALATSDAMSQCLLERIETADAGVTVDELYDACTEETTTVHAPVEAASDTQKESVVDIRRSADFDARTRRFVISTYRANYILVTHNSDPNQPAFDANYWDEEEIKFQVSFKMPIATRLFGGNTDLLFAYTAVSWWQLFNDELDNPFRETNYEPEIFFRGYPRANILGLDFISWELGINHQSNGQSGPLSRGWDRVFASTAVEFTDDLVAGVRAWYILDRQDTNSDIHRYMGYGDIGVGWVPNRNTFTLMYRPSTEGGAAQLTWSYPISQYLRVYAQYWNGYGESLIDYNVRTERIGIGLALSDIIERD